MAAHRLTSALARSGALLAAAGAVHAAVNARSLRVPPTDPAPVVERVSILVPVRDEAHRVGPCLRSVLGQRRVPALEILVLDDGSTDGTADVVRAVAADDRRVRLLAGAALPEGWLGKPWACAQLADAATGSVLVWVDADVVLEPLAVAATVALLRDAGLDLVSPYPLQLADGALPRLLQPLLQWSWLTTLPLRVAERSARPSLAAANGQLLALDTAAYRAAGGHGAVRDRVIDDVALLRAIKTAGGRGGVADGTPIARCRMYASGAEAVDGWTKGLAEAFGSRAGAAGVTALLGLVYVVPPLAALISRDPRARRAGRWGYAAAVAGRVVTGRRTGARLLPDALAHPASITALAALTAESWRRRRAGTLTWKGRTLP